MWHNRTHPQVNSSRGGILSSFSPSRRVPIQPTLHCRSEIQLRDKSGDLYSNKREQTSPLTGQWHPQNRVLCSISSAGSSHHNISHTFYQLDNDQHTLRKRWQTSIIKTAFAPALYSFSRLFLLFGVFCVSINFKVFCSSYVKNAIGNLIGIALNL